MPSMSEQRTGNLGGDRSFEERVFARFDAMDARFNGVDARFDAVDARFNAVDARFDAIDVWRGAVDARFKTIDGWRDSIDVWRSAADGRFDRLENRMGALEEGSERRALETKPIWERALSEILEVKIAVGKLIKKVEVLNREMLTIKADQIQLDERLDRIEKPT